MSNTIPHWLTKQALLSPNQPAIEMENGNVITYKLLQEKSQQYARRLTSLGLKQGDHIGIFSTNQPEMIIAIHALSYIGAVAVLLNIRLTKEELAYQIENAEIRYLLTSKDLEAKMNFNIPTFTFAQVESFQEAEIELKTELRLDDVFTIIYTSGTTGYPKGVVHTYGNHWWSAIGSALNFGLQATDKWLAVLPMFHVGGLSIFIRSVIYGIPVYLMEKFEETAFHQAIFEKGVTIASVVTVMLKRLVNTLKDEKYPETFRCMLLGGGPAPKILLEQANNHEIAVFQSYGMTETSSQIVTLSPADAMNQLGSSGKPLFPAQLKINEPNREGIGEIFVKGPMVTEGYYKNEQANNRVFNDGWLATGDLGYVDEKGFLYVVERRTDLIISGGENIYPTEVENVIARLGEILEVGVIGVPDEKWGQVPVAFVVKTDEISSELIISYAKQRLASYKLPKHIFFIDELPRNASNKLMRKKLLDIYNEIPDEFI